MNMIRVEPCEQMPEGEWAVVSGSNVTVSKFDGSEPPRTLRGTELRRFMRWILRRPTGKEGPT